MAASDSFLLGQFQDLCEFVEIAVFEDATYLRPQCTLELDVTQSKCVQETTIVTQNVTVQSFL